MGRAGQGREGKGCSRVPETAPPYILPYFVLSSCRLAQEIPETLNVPLFRRTGLLEPFTFHINFPTVLCFSLDRHDTCSDYEISTANQNALSTCGFLVRRQCHESAAESLKDATQMLSATRRYCLTTTAFVARFFTLCGSLLPLWPCLEPDSIISQSQGHPWMSCTFTTGSRLRGVTFTKA